VVNTRRHTHGLGALSASDLNGLTFYVPDPYTATVVVDGREMVPIRRNGPDHIGQPSVSLPWPPLEFPQL
jgi:hypothetical protein